MGNPGELDFANGGEHYGKYFPPLRPLDKAVREESIPSRSRFFVYEPGNATRYQVLLSTVRTSWGLETVLTLVNLRKSMIVPGPFHSVSQVGYMHDKLGINEGDCYALMPLINAYLEEDK